MIEKLWDIDQHSNPLPSAMVLSELLSLVCAVRGNPNIAEMSITSLPERFWKLKRKKKNVLIQVF